MLDFQELKNSNPHLEKRLSRMELRYKKAQITLALRDNIIVSDILEELKANIATIETRLLEDRALTDRERDKLFAQRDAWEWFLTKFTNAEIVIENTEKTVNKL